jgi:type I restriction-modification system DNA methylase subunit
MEFYCTLKSTSISLFEKKRERERDGKIVFFNYSYRGADKSLARPGRKQATATEDFEFHIPYL